nr:hypothetical protein [Lactobacillus kitasatonis]
MMFNKENTIDASKLHVDSFKYQSTEDMPNEIYEEWQEKHMNAKIFNERQDLQSAVPQYRSKC